MIQQVTAEQLRSRLAEPGRSPALLDVREPWEYDVCHIAGSTSIPMSQLLARLEELEPSRPTIVICHHGVRSQHVAAYLERCGFSDVMNLVGGVDAWARCVDPAMPTY